MKNNKVLCIGDSTSLPGHTNSYEDTWFYILKQNFPDLDFISLFRRSITTEILVVEGGGDYTDNLPKGADCLEFYNPSIVILQLGIVDCAPRLLNQFDKLIIKLSPQRFNKFYITFLKKIRKRKLSNTIVSPEKFFNNLENYINRCSISKIDILIFISIPYPDNKMVNNNRGIITNIEKYNKIINDVSKEYNFIEIIQPLDCRKYKEQIFEDGYHPNSIGNFIVFQELKEILTHKVQ